MRRLPILFLLMAIVPLGGGPASAQIGLPGLGLPDAGRVLDPLDRTLDRIERDTARIAGDLLRDRERTISRFLRQNSDSVEVDREGQPARRGELLLMDIGPEAAGYLEQQGFALLAQEDIASLGFAVSRFAVPAGMSLAHAESMVASLAPDATVAPDNIHFQSGAAVGHFAVQGSGRAGTMPAATRITVGMIDGAPSLRIGQFAVRGFARGAPVPSNHGSAIAHLLVQTGVRNIRVADVYGTDPAGGGALAIARGLGWLVEDGSRVVTISLVGPRNPVVERAIGAARNRGVVVVAAVGNDGPAAPPAYPASYEGVVAVTGVDGRKRALIEAGRALHLDYAAPGADLPGRDLRGGRVRLRGTSYATPLVAARIAAAMERGANWRIALDAEAEDLGAPGHDEVFGRGLVCGGCGSS